MKSGQVQPAACTILWAIHDCAREISSGLLAESAPSGSAWHIEVVLLAGETAHKYIIPWSSRCKDRPEALSRAQASTDITSACVQSGAPAAKPAEILLCSCANRNCMCRRGKLYTLNAQVPQDKWAAAASDMQTAAGSFRVFA